MVNAMASAYDGLSQEEQDRVFLLAVGINPLEGSNQNFCKSGFSACADDSGWNWWNSWESEQRDVFFYTKQPDGSWEFYCRYSMNSNRDEFDETIREMLEVTEDLALLEASDDLVGNETSTTKDAIDEISLVMSDMSASYASSSHSYSTCAIFATLSAIVLGWTIV